MDGHKLRTMFNIAKIEYMNLLRSTKMIILGMFVIFVNIQIITPLKNCANLMDGKISFLEAFAAMGNSGVVIMILPLFYLVMMADFPRKDGIQLFYQIRCDKIVWIMGQLIFAFFSAVSLTAFALVSSMGLLVSCGKWDLDFSDTITHYVATFPERANDYVVRLLPENLYNQLTLGRTVLHTFLLLSLYFFMMALILMLFTLLNNKLAGILVVGILIVAGVISCAANTVFMWFLPMSHAMTVAHFTKYISTEIFPIRASYLYFVLLDLCMAIACAIVSKRYQIF